MLMVSQCGEDCVSSILGFGLLNPKTLGDGFYSDAGVFCLVINLF